MLLSLHIENVAVIKSLDIDFGTGFTVLSGETGAGKSIIIDCLNLLCGVRADKELIRTGETRAEVCAVFGNINASAMAALSEIGFDIGADEELMLSRVIYTDAQSQARINGRLFPISLLREITRCLFNIHGQSDNQRLLDRGSHMRLLDGYARALEEVEDFGVTYREILGVRERIASIQRDAMANNRMCEMLKYQIEDIDSAKLRAGEEEELSAALKKLQSAERIEKVSSLVDKALCGGERGAGAIYLVDKAASALSQICDAIPEAEGLCARLNDVKYELDDIADECRTLSDVSDGNSSAKIDKIEARLEIISKLKRKYGEDVAKILEFREDAQTRLELIENSDEIREELEMRLSELSALAREKALKIREKRRRAAKRLSDAVLSNLEFLDMPKVKFEVSLREAEDFCATGLDECEFLVATNAGEPLMPMIKIASGGELARIMLSLKSVINREDGIDTAIFDEIDTGISGKTSRKVGFKLREIAKDSQVLCVTHSAQIASLADHHIYISKAEQDGRIFTTARVLSYDERVEEIARILGGINISDLQRSAAREMIEEGNN